MEKITTIGLDLAKSIFQVHAIAEDGSVVTRRGLRRSQVLEFFRKLEPCLVGLRQSDKTIGIADLIVASGHRPR
jgi:transposase